MSVSSKQRVACWSSHQSCRYISSHTTLEHQVQCLSTKMAKLAMTGGKTVHPCRVMEDIDTVKRRPAKLNNNKRCLVSRLSAVTISETVLQQPKRRPASTRDIVLTTGNIDKQLPVNRQTAVTMSETVLQQAKRRPASTRDIVLTTGNIDKHLTVNRQTAVTMRETVLQQPKRRPVSTGEIVSIRQPTLNNKRHSDQLTTGKNNNQMTININNELCSIVAQLLHPDWRKIPWKLYFGWTDAHNQLCKQLQCRVRRGSLESIYYTSAKEHCAAGMTWRYHHNNSLFLGGPAVNTVSEVLEVIRRVHSHDVTCCQLSDAAGPGYDGDDEDDV